MSNSQNSEAKIFLERCDNFIKTSDLSQEFIKHYNLLKGKLNHCSKTEYYDYLKVFFESCYNNHYLNYVQFEELQHIKVNAKNDLEAYLLNENKLNIYLKELSPRLKNGFEEYLEKVFEDKRLAWRKGNVAIFIFLHYHSRFNEVFPHDKFKSFKDENQGRNIIIFTLKMGSKSSNAPDLFKYKDEAHVLTSYYQLPLCGLLDISLPAQECADEFHNVLPEAQAPEAQQKVPNTHATLLIADRLASEIEDYLTIAASIPFFGTIPALAKSIFGITQMLIASGAFLASLPFCSTSFGQEVMWQSLRHFIHGISNVISGLILAVPLIGSAVVAYQYCRNRPSTDAAQCGNNQSHKFFAYKTIEENTWFEGSKSKKEKPTQDKLIYKATFSL